MALPGDNGTIIPPQRFRLAIGETYEKRYDNGDKKMLPRKLDYWTVRRLSYQSGKAPSYVTDPEAQKLMCKEAGVQEKPTVIPITVIGNPEIIDGKPVLPESILWARMARYSGGKCCCTCKDFDAEGKGLATERLFEEKMSKGQQPKPYYVLAQTKEIPCDPQACGWATGDHDQLKYKGTPLCKPQVVLSAGLPWYPVVGTVAKFKTTGWHSYRALRDSLLQIALQTGGWLHGLPLWLVLDWEMAGNGQLVPSVRVEYRGTDALLREAAVEVQGRWLKQGVQLKQLQAGIVEVVAEEEEDEKEQVAHQTEFAHEGYDLKPPIIDGQFEEEPQGEELVLQSPPAEAVVDLPGLDEVVDLATFKACMMALGVKTSTQMARAKAEAGLGEYKLDQLDIEALRKIYETTAAEVAA